MNKRAMESDEAARNASTDELIGLLMLRQSVVTNAKRDGSAQPSMKRPEIAPPMK
jgi:hypothetical protein